MEFSWATISFIDIGLLSFGVIAIASGWIKKKIQNSELDWMSLHVNTRHSKRRLITLGVAMMNSPKD